MKLLKRILPLSLLALLASCTPANNEVIWVSGFKTTCDVGAGEGECLYVQYGEDTENDNWEYFSTSIGNFQFEEGVLRKIEVKKEELDPKDVPADASSIRYTFVNELSRSEDPRIQLQGGWLLASINGGNINRMVVLPTLNIDLKEMWISGNAGCNDYFSRINQVGASKLSFLQTGAYLKECENENIERDYLNALSEVKGYTLKDGMLSLLNEKGEVVLSFIKTQKVDDSELLNGDWLLATMDGGVLNKMIAIPTLGIDMDEMRIFGNGGCNQYFTGIKKLENNQIAFGEVGATMMACAEEDIESEYLEVLGRVKSYEVTNETLSFLDENGKVILTYIKVEMTHFEKALEGDWKALEIDGESVGASESEPILTINAAIMKISGNDGCNGIFGHIQKLTETELKFDNTGTTAQMCADMKVADAFSAAMTKVSKYELQEDHLVLVDEDGNELIVFEKLTK